MKKGFSLIEIIITILIISIFVSVMASVFQEIVKGLGFSGDTVKALSLARLELSKVNNLTFSDTTLADGYNNTTSDYESSSYDLNRAVSIVPSTSSNLKKVIVSVYPSVTTTVLAKLVTYVADIDFGPGSSGSSPGSETQADSLTVTSGTIKKKDLKDIVLSNGSTTDAITWTKVNLTFTGTVELKKIKQHKTTLWSGTASSGDTITLSSSLAIPASDSKNKVKFTFNSNVSTVHINYFEFSDASQADNSGSGWSW